MTARDRNPNPQDKGIQPPFPGRTGAPRQRSERESADVVISYLDEHEDAEETARVIREAGRKAELVPGDIGSADHCRSIVEGAMSLFGRIDVPVNHAAFQMTHDHVTPIPADEIERTFRTNIMAMFWLCQAAVLCMKPGSTILNSNSIQA